MISMDMEQFNSTAFQRVYQYSCRYLEHVPFDEFTYQPHSVEGGPTECLFAMLS